MPNLRADATCCQLLMQLMISAMLNVLPVGSQRARLTRRTPPSRLTYTLCLGRCTRQHNGSLSWATRAAHCISTTSRPQASVTLCAVCATISWQAYTLTSTGGPRRTDVSRGTPLAVTLVQSKRPVEASRALQAIQATIASSTEALTGRLGTRSCGEPRSCPATRAGSHAEY